MNTPSTNVNSSTSPMFAGNAFFALIASSSGAKVHAIAMKGWTATACSSCGCDSAKVAPAMVQRTLTNTSAYVRLTSVARSAPVRTRIPVGERNSHLLLRFDELCAAEFSRA